MSILNASDVFCYICRGIFIEPVTLPCAHVFCYTCFEQSMQETSHSCPLCRKRISNWIRSVKKTNKLIDTKLWEKIKDQYKEQVRLKLAGEDDGLNEVIQVECDVHIPLSKSGEVAQEYSKLLNDFQREQQKINEAEELASRELIEKLRLEEQMKLQQLKDKNLKRTKQDEKLAKMMQEDFLKERRETNSIDKHGRSLVKKISKGPMDDFVKGGRAAARRVKKEETEVTSSHSTIRESEGSYERDTSSESTDSFSMELNFFKPIKKVLRTPPKRYPDGRIREINLTRVTPVKLSFGDQASKSSVEISSVEGKRIHSLNSAFVDAISVGQTKCSEDEVKSSPKRLKFSSRDESNETEILKDITTGENADSNSTCTIHQNDGGKKKPGSVKHIPSLAKYLSAGANEDGENGNFETQDYLCPAPDMEDKLIEEQRRIEEIILQERKDRELAVKLSREWESEERRKPQTRSMLLALADSAKSKTHRFKDVRTRKTPLKSRVLNKRTKGK